MLADDDDDDEEEEAEAEEEDDRVLNFHIFFWLRADCYQRWAVNWLVLRNTGGARQSQ